MTLRTLVELWKHFGGNLKSSSRGFFIGSLIITRGLFPRISLSYYVTLSRWIYWVDIYYSNRNLNKLSLGEMTLEMWDSLDIETLGFSKSKLIVLRKTVKFHKFLTLCGLIVLWMWERSKVKNSLKFWLIL
jgi:hypothetical protein